MRHLLFLAFTALLLARCGSGIIGNPELPELPSVTGEMTARINGRPFEAELAGIGIEPILKDTTFVWLNLIGVSGDANNEESLWITLFFDEQFADVESGTYEYDPDCDYGDAIPCLAASYTLPDGTTYGLDEEGTGTLTLEFYDASLGEAARGTFSFLMQGDSTSTAEVVDGEFNVVVRRNY